MIPNMVLLRQNTRFLTVARQSSHPTVLHPRRFYAEKAKKSAEEGSGITKETDKNAKPRILEHIPDAEDTEEVRKHNKEFEERPDRASNVLDPENKETVGKGYWKGNFMIPRALSSGPADGNRSRRSR